MVTGALPNWIEGFNQWVEGAGYTFNREDLREVVYVCNRLVNDVGAARAFVNDQHKRVNLMAEGYRGIYELLYGETARIRRERMNRFRQEAGSNGDQG